MRKTALITIAIAAMPLLSAEKVSAWNSWDDRVQASEVLADRDERAPRDGVRFMDAVPTWADPARARPRSGADSVSSEHPGSLSSVYRSGDYEVRTYHDGNVIRSITTKGGKVQSRSEYQYNLNQ